MNELKGRELEEENDIYNILFADQPSDEDFKPESEDLDDDSFNSDEENNEAAENDDEAEEENFEIKEEINTKQNNKYSTIKKRRDIKEQIIDLDDLDIDAIDELESRKKTKKYSNKQDQGLSIEDPKIYYEEDDDSFTAKKTKIIKKPKLNRVTKNNKAFIDDEEKVFLNRKRLKQTNKSKKQKRPINYNKINENIIFDKEKNLIIIPKSLLDYHSNKLIENEENDSDIVYDEQNLNKQYEEETKNAKSKKLLSVNKASYIQEKISQEDLLISAIFTQIYNQKSLEELMKLEELSKPNYNINNKKIIVDYVKTVRKLQNLKTDLDKDSNCGIIIIKF